MSAHSRPILSAAIRAIAWNVECPISHESPEVRLVAELYNVTSLQVVVLVSQHWRYIARMKRHTVIADRVPCPAGSGDE